MKKTALLIIDVQTALIEHGMYKSEKVIENIRLLKEQAEKNQIEVIYVVHDSGLGSILEYNSPGWKVYKDIEPKNNEKLFNKKFNSAFKETGLKEYLNERGIKRLVVAGLQTEYCINFSLIGGLEHGYEFVIPEDCITTCDGVKFNAAEINDFYYNVIWKNRVGNVLPINEILWK